MTEEIERNGMGWMWKICFLFWKRILHLAIWRFILNVPPFRKMRRDFRNLYGNRLFSSHLSAKWEEIFVICMETDYLVRLNFKKIYRNLGVVFLIIVKGLRKTVQPSFMDPTFVLLQLNPRCKCRSYCIFVVYLILYDHCLFTRAFLLLECACL